MLFSPIHPIKLGIIKLQGLFPARQKYLADMVGNKIQSAFQAYQGLDEKWTDPALLEKLKPEIEIHIDHFLKEKLKTVFPMLAQFMGEKTISQFKTAFLVEIDHLLPVLIRSYMDGLKNEIRLDEIVSEKINAIHAYQLEKIFYENSKKEIRYFLLACTGIGLLFGMITVGMLCLFLK